jgi:hypothetical protein
VKKKGKKIISHLFTSTSIVGLICLPEMCKPEAGHFGTLLCRGPRDEACFVFRGGGFRLPW